MMRQANRLCHPLLRTEPLELLIFLWLSAEMGVCCRPSAILTCCECRKNAAAAQAVC